MGVTITGWWCGGGVAWGILKEAENGIAVADLLRQYNISQGTYYRWKSAYSGMQINELKRLKELEKENARLKKLVAEQALDIDILKDVNSKNW